MKVIKCLVENMRDELCDGRKYARLAIEYRESDKRLADVFAGLSAQELAHANNLHAQAQRIISDSKEETPTSMQVIWDWEHDRMIEDMTAINVLLDLYKKN